MYTRFPFGRLTRASRGRRKTFAFVCSVHTQTNICRATTTVSFSVIYITASRCVAENADTFLARWSKFCVKCSNYCSTKSIRTCIMLIQCRPALKNLLFQARLSSYWLPRPEHQFLYAKFLFRSPFFSRNGHSCYYFNTDCSIGGCQP